MKELTDIPGISASIAAKLRKAGVTTPALLKVHLPHELSRKTGIAEETIKKIKMNAGVMDGTYGFRSGLVIESEMESQPPLMTGLKTVDGLLFGGFEQGALVEFYGEASSGKTQWCAHLAVRAQLPIAKGGLRGSVLWVDTEDTFKPHVIRANALRWGIDPDQAVGNISVAKAGDTERLTGLLDQIPKLCIDESIKLVVVDSFTGLFRREYQGASKLMNRQWVLNDLLGHMRRTTKATDVTFIYTNHATITTGFGSDTIAPVGGHILAHGSDYRFHVELYRKDMRKLILIDNAGLPPFNVALHLGWGGFYGDLESKNEFEPAIKEYLTKIGVETNVSDTSPTEIDEIGTVGDRT